MAQVQLVGKEVEILQYVAMNGPCTHAELRKTKKHWSSRTIWKQIRRMEKDGLIRQTLLGYEATDRGFLESVSHALRFDSALAKNLMQVATKKFPHGRTARKYGWIPAAKPPTREGALREFRKWYKHIDKILSGKIPVDRNFSMQINTKRSGQVWWRFSTG